MTDDNWQTTKLAIGLVGGRYSVNAEVIAGTLIAGEQLTIKNTNNSFVVDANGARLTNASISVERRNANNDIISNVIINPDYGIKIQKVNPSSGEAEDNFYTDISGNLHMRGDIYAESGTFNGTVYATDGVFSGRIEASTVEASSFIGGSFEGDIECDADISGGSLSGAIIYFGTRKSGGKLFGGTSGATLDTNNGIFEITAVPAGGNAYTHIDGNLVLGNPNAWTGNVSLSDPSQATGHLIANGGADSEKDNYSIYAAHGVYGHQRIKSDTFIEAGYAMVLRGEQINQWSDLEKYIGGGGAGKTNYIKIASYQTEDLSAPTGLYHLGFDNGIITSFYKIL